MMKINPYHVLNLSPHSDTPCLSLYANSMKELAVAIGRAEDLALRRFDAKTLDKLLRPIHGFYRGEATKIADAPVAVFSAQNFSGYARLPFHTSPLAVVASSFHVKPLLKWMQREHPFSLLVLEENEAILYQGSLSYFEELERLPYRELRTMDGAFNALDRAVYRSIQSSRVPLLLAGELELIEIYKNLSGYRAILDESILDPNEYKNPEVLHKTAIAMLEPYFEQKEANALQSYWAAERSGRTSSVLQDIVQLALARRVKHLFVNERMHVWGKIDSRTGKFTYNPSQTEPEDDVLDDLAEIALRNHASVTILPAHKMPKGYAACAILNAEAISLQMAISEGKNQEERLAEQAVS